MTRQEQLNEDPRETLRELANKRASEKGIPKREALEQVKAGIQWSWTSEIFQPLGRAETCVDPRKETTGEGPLPRDCRSFDAKSGSRPGHQTQ